METRTIKSELVGNGKRVSGYAIRFDSPTIIRGERPKPFTEVIRAGSLNLNPDLKLLWSHLTDNVLASTSGNTLTVRQDEKGLYIEAELPESAAREREALTRGDVSGMSFSFSVNKEKWTDNSRELLDINVGEISLVAFPAYQGAGVTGLRSKREMQMQWIQKSLPEKIGV
jgi:hypothetical protein